MNHAAGMETSVDPNEYGRQVIPAANGDSPFTACHKHEKCQPTKLADP